MADDGWRTGIRAHRRVRGCAGARMDGDGRGWAGCYNQGIDNRISGVYDSIMASRNGFGTIQRAKPSRMKGNIMETKGKRLITTEEKDGLFIVRTEGQADLQIKLADLTEEIRHTAMVHGLKQKIVDAAALGRDEVTGKSASPEAKHAEMEKVTRNLIAGVWNGGRSGGGDGTAGQDNLTVRAIAHAYNMSLEWADGQVEKLAEKRGIDRRAALKLFRERGNIIQAIAALKAVKSGVDADDLIWELEGD